MNSDRETLEHGLGDPDLLEFHLASLPGMGPVSYRKLLNRFGSAERVLLSSRDELIRETGIRNRLAETIVASSGEIDRSAEDLENLVSIGGRVLYPDMDRVPQRLKKHSREWHFLTLFGNGSLLDKSPIVGVVGRRRASAEGKQFAYDLATELAEYGVVTLSGMADGIDQAAHMGSLGCGGSTIALLPEGLFRFFRRNRKASRAAEGGEKSLLLLVSGAAPSAKWSVAEAMRRNAWIASWSDALVVAEAGEKGGTWKTAREAHKRGKPLWVATGFKQSDAGLGNEALVRDLEGTPAEVTAGPARLVRKILASV